MADKAYAILYASIDEDNGYLYFPIARDGRTYGGMPQFFGGTKNAGESDRDTIAREMAEESDDQITLQAGGLTRVFATPVGGDNYAFYVAENWTGQHFLGPLRNNEMASIQKFLVRRGEEDTIEDLMTLQKIVPSLAFAQSATYTAFDKAIQWAEPGLDARRRDDH